MQGEEAGLAWVESEKARLDAILKSAPPTVSLVGHVGKSAKLMGVYRRAEEKANEYPLFKQDEGLHYLYRANDSGCWMVAADKERFAQNLGILKSKAAAELPTPQGMEWEVLTCARFLSPGKTADNFEDSVRNNGWGLKWGRECCFPLNWLQDVARAHGAALVRVDLSGETVLEFDGGGGSCEISHRADVTDAHVQFLAEHAPNLTQLDLCGCSQVSDSSIRLIAKHCRKLTYLGLGETAVTVPDKGDFAAGWDWVGGGGRSESFGGGSADISALQRYYAQLAAASITSTKLKLVIMGRGEAGKYS